MTRIYQSSWGRTNPRHGFHERTENGGAVHGCTRRHQEVGARMGRAHDSDDTDSCEQDGALVFHKEGENQTIARLARTTSRKTHRQYHYCI